LVDRWQGYLAESIAQITKGRQISLDYSDDVLEKRWKEELDREASFHEPTQEKVIQCWESCLMKARGKDNGNGSGRGDGSNYK
jgi:hypothetical protein